MQTVGKSKNLKNVSDDLFDAIENSSALEHFSNLSQEILKTMSCKHCGGEIRYSRCGWGDSITFKELTCRDCKRLHGYTGYRIYNLDKSEVTGWLWLWNWIAYFLFDTF